MAIDPQLTLDMRAESYFAPSTGISNSMLGDFLRSPRLYERRYVHGINDRESSDSMDLGTLAHAAILEPNALEQRYKLIPDDVLSKSGARAGQAWKDFAAANQGVILINQQQLDAIHEIAASVRRCDVVAEALDAPGHAECAIQWVCEACGMLRKARLDWLTADYAAVIDIKTTRDCSAQAFARSVVNYGYHRQAAYYTEAVEALSGKRPPFVFVAVQSEPPYVARAYTLDADAMALGMAEVVEGLQRLRDASALNDWREPGENQITILPLPAWAYHADEWRVISEQ